MAAVACAGVLAGCGSTAATEPNEPEADIARVSQVKSTFGNEFQYRDIAPTGIDPKLLQPQKMPPGLTFRPPECAAFAEGQLPEADLKGNMAAATAEGEGNRFIALAVETNEPVPVPEPGDACKKVEFGGAALRGLVEVVEAPQIDGVQTAATHRVLQTVVAGAPRTGELYNYTARFGPYMVIVTANPLVIPNKPVAPVNTERARQLLVDAVAAVRG
ncbi:hypothetical protein MLIT_53550 [Mycolicibacterium litorale]|uniref:DUF5642 domain-containing protein n=2 Tax=Mycolicibacterium litorale TaxID=758802 RepID=A0AAD1IS21_9MYCO|nr:hypothetical protein BCL50_2410 [Mycolicibacterium litorale]BBY19763.1 hypothetical protein MLIT_53550 [Mycolicibacterium litorale]